MNNTIKKNGKIISFDIKTYNSKVTIKRGYWIRMRGEARTYHIVDISPDGWLKLDSYKDSKDGGYLIAKDNGYSYSFATLLPSIEEKLFEIQKNPFYAITKSSTITKKEVKEMLSDAINRKPGKSKPGTLFNYTKNKR